MSDDMPDPNGWDWGPPKSQDESWRWERRCELLKISEILLVHRIGQQEDDDEDDVRELVSGCVNLAAELIQDVDGRFPRN